MDEREEQLARIAILEENGVVSKTAADFARYAVELLAGKDYSHDALEALITHLAMAGERTLSGVEEEGYDEAVLEALKEEEGYEKAVELRDELLSDCQIPFSKSEREFLLVHVFNLIS